MALARFSVEVATAAIQPSAVFVRTQPARAGHRIGVGGGADDGQGQRGQHPSGDALQPAQAVPARGSLVVLVPVIPHDRPPHLFVTR